MPVFVSTKRGPKAIEDTVELHAGLLRGWDGGALVRSLLEASGTPEERSMLTRYLEAPTEGSREARRAARPLGQAL